MFWRYLVPPAVGLQNKPRGKNRKPVGAGLLRWEAGALLKGREVKVAVIPTFGSVLILLVSFVLFCFMYCLFTFFPIILFLPLLAIKRRSIISSK